MIGRVVFSVALMAGAFASRAGNLIPNPGFETWAAKENRPTASSWQWNFGDRALNETAFEFFGRSNSEKHSGEWSLHLKDAYAGKANNTFDFMVAGNRLPRLAGKTVVFSAWVRQVSASKAGVVGIALWTKGKDGKSHAVFRGIDSAGEAPWQQLKVRLRLPGEPTVLFAKLCCANGYGNTAEAYFDDLELTVEEEPDGDGAAAQAATAFRRRYERPVVFESDAYRRPAIRNGTWYSGGRPVFFYGPWLYGRRNANGDWTEKSNPPEIEHIAYTAPPSREVCDAMGFNSAQISAAPAMPGAALYGLAVTEPEAHEKNISEFYAGFRGLPLVVDFAFGFWKKLAADDPPRAAELEQRFADWHEFLPACPEAPEGDRYYRDFFRGGVISVLAKGGNPFVWELFNESSYNCECRYNAAAFAAAMERRYGTVEAANRQWGTVFDSFRDVARTTGFRQYPRLWPDWCKFSARRYAELLREYGALIRSIDRRPDVRLSEQTSNMKLYQGNGAGMDYRLIAAELDSLGIEGGRRYGDGGFSSSEPMEAAAAAEQVSYPFICDLFQALSGGVKPVMNHEHYCGRFEFGKRVPSRREDIVTSMWAEIMHGLSGSYHYCWDKRAFEWKTFEQAKANVINGGYKAFSTLNPYNWPVAELDGFRQFMQELEPYRDRLLPFPRFRKPAVAIFYSYPTLRMLPISRENFKRKMFNWYAALLYGNYPLRFVFEEEVAAGLPQEIGALVVPCATYMADGTLESLRRFAASGRIVIADREAFRFDEYGTAVDASGLACRRLDAADPVSAREVREILAAAGVRRDAVLEPLDGRPCFPAAEAHLIDRGDFKFVCLVNWGGQLPVPARLKLAVGEEGIFHLTDIVNRRELLPERGDGWTRELLGAGVELFLPPQQRVLLILERRPPENAVRVRPAGMRALRREAIAREKTDRAGYFGQLEELRRQYDGVRRWDGVRPECCRAVELSGVVNMGFRDEIAGDGRGGWFDQGENDFARMPLGAVSGAGVPFTVIDPAANGGRSALILSGRPRPSFPAAAKDIPVNGKVAAFYFLHACGWDPPRGERVMSYIVRYDDGTDIEIPVRSGIEIGGWWGTAAPEQAKIAVESFNAVHDRISLQCFRWRNPAPEKTVRSIDIVSAGGSGVPAVVAITAEEP